MKKIRFSGVARKWCGTPYTEVVSIYITGWFEQVVWHKNTHGSCFGGFRTTQTHFTEISLRLK